MNHHLERRVASCWHLAMYAAVSASLLAMYVAVSAWHLEMYVAVSASILAMHAAVLDKVFRWFVPATDAVPIAPHAIISPTVTRGRFMMFATLALKRLSASFVYMGMNQMSSLHFTTNFIQTRRMGAEPHGGTPWRNPIRYTSASSYRSSFSCPSWCAPR